MELKDAVKTAKSIIIDLFADEDIDQVGLEEVVYSPTSETWKVTIGFRRPWTKRTTGGLLSGGSSGVAARWYKQVELSQGGELRAVTDRELSAAA